MILCHSLFAHDHSLSTEEVAEYLRVRVSKVDQLRREGSLSGVRTARTWIYSRAAVFALAQSLFVPASVAEGTPVAIPHTVEALETEYVRQQELHFGSCGAGVLDILNVMDVAVLLGATPRQVSGWANQGRLAGVKFGRDWLFSSQAVGEYLQRELQADCSCRATNSPIGLSAPIAAAAIPASVALLCVEDVGQILGKSGRFVEDLARRGSLRGFKVGRQWRFVTGDVDAFVLSLRDAAPRGGYRGQGRTRPRRRR